MASASSSTQPITRTTTRPKGPFLTVLTNRLKTLRKKRTRILQMERSLSQGQQLTPEQHAEVCSLSDTSAKILELEELRDPLSDALDEELKAVEDMVVERYKMKEGKNPVEGADAAIDQSIENVGSSKQVPPKRSYVALVKEMSQALCNVPEVIAIADPASYHYTPESFPEFPDGDTVRFYPKAFKLSTWLRFGGAHRFSTLTGRRHDHQRLRREAAIVIQSLVTAVISHLDQHHGHANLGDASIFTLTQRVVDVGGSKKVRFMATISHEPGNAKSPVDSMGDFIRLLRTLFVGMTKGVLSDEINFMLATLGTYPFHTRNVLHVGTRALLSHYPGLWDCFERRSFYLLLFLHVQTDGRFAGFMVELRLRLLEPPRIDCLSNWHSKIPKDTIYEDIFHGGKFRGEVQYPQGSLYSLYHYMRVAHQHFFDHQDANLTTSIKETEFEDFLSSIFSMLLVKAYKGMCRLKLFF